MCQDQILHDFTANRQKYRYSGVVVISVQNSSTSETAKQNIVEKMWLNYYNNILLDKGLITKEQHRKMKTYISTRKPKTL